MRVLRRSTGSPFKGGSLFRQVHHVFGFLSKVLEADHSHGDILGEGLKGLPDVIVDMAMSVEDLRLEFLNVAGVGKLDVGR